jgi:hypothetical protein
MFRFYSDINGYGGEIRGQQMATALGGTFNRGDPEEGDVCIYLLALRPQPEPRYAYHDIMDSPLYAYARMAKRTRGDMIAISNAHAGFLVERFPNRTIHYLPQHHCNFERVQREPRPALVVGTIGGYSAVQWPHKSLERYFNEAGMVWRFADNVRHREQVVAFYKSIDIQFVFRPTHMRSNELRRCLSPLKLINAGSFGIPTVAYPEPGYTSEWTDQCLWGDSLSECIRQAKRLKENPTLYEEVAGKAREKSEQYHIERITPLYRQLPGATA